MALTSKLLSFDKPKKVHSTEEHNAMYSSDSGVAGTYVPNMSEADMKKWKGKLIGGKDPRVEIRKSVYGKVEGEKYGQGANILIVVRPSTLKMSANGSMVFTHHVWYEMQQVVEEAKEALLKLQVPK